MAAKRATQRDIALKAGVDRSTVSLALKNHPRIPEETKRRILEIAQKMGYMPDPMLSALAHYRNQQRPQIYHGTLAWLVNSLSGYNWKGSPHYTKYFSGAAKRAQFHGYKLEEFTLNSEGLSAHRLASILYARDISGILLCPQPKADMRMDFAWDQFSTVTLGYTLTEPHLHTVASAHYLNTRHIMRHVAERGYKRPGLVIDFSTDKRCGSNVYAGYLIEQALNRTMVHIPPFFDYSPGVPKKLAEYIRSNQIDVVLVSEYKFLETLKLAGLSAPDDISVAALSLPGNDVLLSGILEDSEKIGSVAVDLLVGMVQRGERGIPPIPIRTHLEGTWNEGKTLKKLEKTH